MFLLLELIAFLRMFSHSQLQYAFFLFLKENDKNTWYIYPKILVFVAEMYVNKKDQLDIRYIYMIDACGTDQFPDLLLFVI